MLHKLTKVALNMISCGHGNLPNALISLFLEKLLLKQRILSGREPVIFAYNPSQVEMSLLMASFMKAEYTKYMLCERHFYCCCS